MFMENLGISENFKMLVFIHQKKTFKKIQTVLQNSQKRSVFLFNYYFPNYDPL